MQDNKKYRIIIKDKAFELLGSEIRELFSPDRLDLSDIHGTPPKPDVYGINIKVLPIPE